MEIKRFCKTDNGSFSSIFMMQTLGPIKYYKVYGVTPNKPAKIFYDGKDNRLAHEYFEALVLKYTLQPH